MSVHCPHKWWSILKSAAFALSSSLPPIVGGGGKLVCESVCQADLLSDNFDGKQSRSLLICRSLDILLLDLPPLPSG